MWFKKNKEKKEEYIEVLENVGKAIISVTLEDRCKILVRITGYTYNNCSYTANSLSEHYLNDLATRTTFQDVHGEGIVSSVMIGKARSGKVVSREDYFVKVKKRLEIK